MWLEHSGAQLQLRPDAKCARPLGRARRADFHSQPRTLGRAATVSLQLASGARVVLQASEAGPVVTVSAASGATFQLSRAGVVEQVRVCAVQLCAAHWR
jgi:hypothetical protein